MDYVSMSSLKKVLTSYNQHFMENTSFLAQGICFKDANTTATALMGLEPATLWSLK